MARSCSLQVGSGGWWGVGAWIGSSCGCCCCCCCCDILYGGDGDGDGDVEENDNLYLDDS